MCACWGVGGREEGDSHIEIMVILIIPLGVKTWFWFLGHVPTKGPQQ